MKYAVVGGAGFIGSAIVKELAKQGHEIVVLDDFSTGLRTNLEDIPSVEINEGDFSEQMEWFPDEDDTSDHFTLINFGAVSRVGQDDYKTLMVNYGIMLNCLEIASKGNCTLVHAGSCAASSEWWVNSYSMSKSHNEDLCDFYRDNKGVQLKVVNPFNIYGENCPSDGGAANAVSIFLDKKKRGQPIVIYGDGSCTRDYVHIDDFVDAFMRILKYSGPQREFSVGTGVGTTTLELAEMFAPTDIHFTKPREEADNLVNHHYFVQSELGWKPQVNLRKWVAEKISKKF